MRFATLFGAMIGAAAIGAGGTYALANQQATQDRATYAAQAVLESRAAYEVCGATTVIVIGANAYGAGLAQHMARDACGPKHMPDGGDGLPPGYLVRER